MSYYVDHVSGSFIVMTNADESYNYRLYAVPDSSLLLPRSSGRLLWPHSPTAMLLRFEVYATRLVLFTLEDETYRIALLPLDNPTAISWVPVPEATQVRPPVLSHPFLDFLFCFYLCCYK